MMIEIEFTSVCELKSMDDDVSGYSLSVSHDKHVTHVGFKIIAMILTTLSTDSI